MNKSFFISYNKADNSWAEWIAWTLEDHGYTTIIQAWDFLPGSNFVLEMQNATAQADCVIALLSQPYLDALYTHPEWASGFAQDPKGSSGRLLPVKVGECSLDGILATIIHVDLSNLDEGTATEKLLAAASRKRTKPINPPSFPILNKSLSIEKPPFPLPNKSSNPESKQQIHTINGAVKSEKTGWKPFVLPALIGLALGLIVAAILTYYGLWVNPRRHTGDGGVAYIVGGGTAYTYLRESGFFKALDKDQQISYRDMQGPTGTAAALFPHVFEDVTFIVMASRKLTLRELQSNGMPQAVFEAYLGPDSLQILFVDGKRGSNDSVLYNDFKEILTDPLSKQLDFANLRNSGKWVNGDYAVYTGSEDSGTRAIWEKRLPSTQLAKWWPSKLNLWNIRAPYDMINLAPAPRIYLGSEVLFRDPLRTLEDSRIPHKELNMFDGSKGRAARGLYLYGFININQAPVRHGNDYGYYLPKSVVLILRHVYRSNLYLLDKEGKCLNQQIAYFHLESEQESEAGWVSTDSGKGGIFRADPCDDQPED